MSRDDPQDLDFFIGKSLAYEVGMLRQTYLSLQIERTPGFELNVLIESFCLHSRNLIEFFQSDRKSADPRAFTISFAINKHFLDGRLIGKINKQITHLTMKRRSEQTQKIDQDDRRAIYDALEREIRRFYDHLSGDYRHKVTFARAAGFTA